jgi:nucleoside-diphosphate-sugar epimerase
VVAAARGVSLIVHAVNPPGYRNWSELVLPMLENTIAAARASGARILLPGTVYNYGPDAFANIDETSPQNPATRKGAIRVEMERRLRVAAETGVKTLIARAGDFFGPKAGNNWFSQGLIKPGRPVSSVQLAEREDLEPFATFNMKGHWDADGTQMIAAIRRVVAQPSLKVRAFPWWMLALASPFVPLFRELREMRYLWDVPVRMNNARLVALLGAEPHTPIDDAVRATLQGLGCLAKPERRA